MHVRRKDFAAFPLSPLPSLNLTNMLIEQKSFHHITHSFPGLLKWLQCRQAHKSFRLDMLMLVLMLYIHL